jgi:transcription antitermination factor NusG
LVSKREVTERWRGKASVIVTSGPLLRYEGHISRIDRRKGRVRVSFQFDGQRRYVDLAVNVLAKVGGAGMR